MAPDVKFEPVPHDHEEILARASMRNGFVAAYESLEEEYALVRDAQTARARVGHTEPIPIPTKGRQRNGK